MSSLSRSWRGAGAPWVMLLVVSCGEGGDGSSRVLSGDTVCERATSLASYAGCTVPLRGCQEPAPRCVELGKTWLDCAATNLAQCICESDGDLNCEGSFKANEGPAQCIPEMQEYNACTDSP